MNLEDLKSAVIKLLVLEHDFLQAEAEETVDDSVEVKPDFWNENAIPEDLANLLASDDNDE